MGALLAVAMSRGKCHWEKTRAVSASRLTASASGCSSVPCQHKAARGTGDPVPAPPVPARHRDQCEDTWDTADRLDWDSTTVLGQYFLFAMALQTALTGSNMAWTKSKWDNDYILFCLFSFHINVLMEKRKTLSVSGTVTFLFYQVRLLFLFSRVVVMMLFYSSKEKHKI